MDPRSTLRLGHRLEGISIGSQSGPGRRMIVYLQGCSLRCTARCLNPHLLASDGGHLVGVDELAERLRWIAEDVPDAKDLTVLGGEPLDQAPALAALLRRFRTGGGSVMLYTGRVHDELAARGTEAERDVLRLVDLLVDGPFVDALHDETLVWRGSSNQRVLRLTDRYSEAELSRAIAEQCRGCSITSAPSTGRVTAGPQSIVAALSLAGRATRQTKP